MRPHDDTCTPASLCDPCRADFELLKRTPDPLAIIAWPHPLVDPPADEREWDIYRRTGVGGLIGWRAELELVAKLRAERDGGDAA